MSPRAGRPKARMGRPKIENPKSIVKRARMSNEDVAKLQFCCRKTGLTESEVLRLGIDMVYQKIKQK